MCGQNMKSCDYGDCSEKGENISRLSPEGFLVATGNKAYSFREAYNCLLYTSDAADDLLCVDLGGRRIIKKKK